MSRLLLPDRAPFIAPGRRNRRVHWNRALTKAMESLGKYEREDWGRANWLPPSLRGFYPKFSHYPCGDCCGDSPDPCEDVDDCYGGTSPTESEVDVPAFANNGHASCTNCAAIEGTYVLTPFGSGVFRYLDSPASVVCGSVSSLLIFISFTCADEGCQIDGNVQINWFGGADLQYSYYNILPGGSPTNYYNYASLPWSLPYLGEFAPGSDSICTTSDPMIVQSFS